MRVAVLVLLGACVPKAGLMSPLTVPMPARVYSAESVAFEYRELGYVVVESWALEPALTSLLYEAAKTTGATDVIGAKWEFEMVPVPVRQCKELGDLCWYGLATRWTVEGRAVKREGP